jgi:hypothetical protein
MQGSDTTGEMNDVADEASERTLEKHEMTSNAGSEIVGQVTPQGVRGLRTNLERLGLLQMSD